MRIVVIGLGYVGLPLAVALARHFETWGLDIDTRRIEELRGGHDRTGEIDDDRLAATSLQLVSDAEACPVADAYIVTVPTPIDGDNQPDLRPVEGATRMIAKMIAGSDRKPVIIYESTVYPGVTEDICGPLLEEMSGLTRGEDFFLGYSPERINPGDREHTVDRITKVIAGENDEITEKLADIYGRVTSGGVYRAASIKAAEAAKVIENTQRDINIAFMNELARIFDRMDLSIWDVLDAAGTKWNFLPFQPGLVGGHCIGVDPFYLSHRAQQLGYEPELILAGRTMNDGMADWMAQRIHRALDGKPGRILFLGVTFKENVPDLRNSKAADLANALSNLGHAVTIHDPLADPTEAKHELGVDIAVALPDGRFDCVVGAVSHDAFASIDPAGLTALLSTNGLVADIKRMWQPEAVRAEGLRSWTL